ncbi:MAG: hypothetical protein KJ638_15260 [Chloroflexi bacterium]|nr:hypothetical protein [Chloroflexota bacterium]
MKTRKLLYILLLVIALGMAACQTASPPDASVEIVSTEAVVISTEISGEIPVTVIPLDGDIAKPSAEISGLAWYREHLVLLPQYPGLFASSGDGSLFTIPKEQILAYLDGVSTDTITADTIALIAPGLAEGIQDFEGYESIAFDTDIAYLTIEASPGSSMLGYVVSGELNDDLIALTLGIDTLQEIPPQAKIGNMSDEAVLVVSDQVLTFYEANGANVNPKPAVHLFDLALYPLGTQPFATIEYRITDVTAPDAEGRFWAINYMYPGDKGKLDPAADELTALYAEGATHARSEVVERLVEFQYTAAGVLRTDTPPIQLQLLDNGEARNWEGIVRLDDRGFLLVTDKFPGTILAFVPLP